MKPLMQRRKLTVRRLRAVRTGDHLTIDEVRDIQSETALRSAVCEYLRLRGIPHSITDAARVWGPDGKPRRSRVAEGWCDVTACLPGGRFWGIETKRALRGRLSPAQIQVHAQLRAVGAVVTVVKRLEDVETVLREWLWVRGEDRR